MSKRHKIIAVLATVAALATVIMTCSASLYAIPYLLSRAEASSLERMISELPEPPSRVPGWDYKEVSTGSTGASRSYHVDATYDSVKSFFWQEIPKSDWQFRDEKEEQSYDQNSKLYYLDTSLFFENSQEYCLEVSILVSRDDPDSVPINERTAVHLRIERRAQCGTP